MILALNVVYSLAAVSLMLLLGQFLVRVLSFGRHEQNPIYRLFRFMTGPVVRLTRAITPARVADEHVPVVAFLLMFWICVALAVYLPRLAGVKP